MVQRNLKRNLWVDAALSPNELGSSLRSSLGLPQAVPPTASRHWGRRWPRRRCCARYTTRTLRRRGGSCNRWRRHFPSGSSLCPKPHTDTPYATAGTPGRGEPSDGDVASHAMARLKSRLQLWTRLVPTFLFLDTSFSSSAQTVDSLGILFGDSWSINYSRLAATAQRGVCAVVLRVCTLPASGQTGSHWNGRVDRPPDELGNQRSSPLRIHLPAICFGLMSDARVDARGATHATMHAF